MNLESMTSSDKYREEIDYYLRYASDDCVMVGLVFGSADSAIQAVTNVDLASLEGVIAVGETMLRELFEKGVLAGQLTAGDPGFERWPGSGDDWLARIHEWIIDNGDIPQPGACCWLHDPTVASRRAATS